MPRSARLVLPGYPHHVIQRGHNRSPLFVQDADYRFYVRTLRDGKLRFDCKVYAYCLMTNHVHLVVEPGEDPASLGLLMKRLAGRYTRYVNRVEARSGTVWDGRFKSSPIDTERYLLACCRYVERNPLRAGMVVDPADYPWSSFGARTDVRGESWIDDHPVIAGFGTHPKEQRARYREWVLTPASAAETSLIRVAAQRGQLTGDSAFQQVISARLGRRLELRGPGRPAARSEDPSGGNARK